MTPLRLNRKLVLEGPFQTPDGSGGFDESWVALGTLWGAVKVGSGRETEPAGLSISSVPYRITVRAAPEGAPSRPLAGQRFRDGGRIFRILAVGAADPDYRYLTCIAREEVTT